MTDLVTYRSRARIDLLEQFVHLGQEASLDTASRYLAAVEATCALLCTQPRMGTTWPSTLGQVSEMRRFPVRGFNNYLIFCRHTALKESTSSAFCMRRETSMRFSFRKRMTHPVDCFCHSQRKCISLTHDKRRSISELSAHSKKSVNASTRFARASSMVAPWLATSTSGHNAT